MSLNLKDVLLLAADEDESAEDADDDDDDDDVGLDDADDDADDDDESEEDEADDPDGDDDDAIDLFSELLGDDDDDVTPKPKPTAAAPAVAAVVEAATEAAAADPPKKVVVNEPEITADVVEDEDFEDELEPEPTKRTPARAKPKKPFNASPELPPLNLQNTPALLELQAQLTGSSVKNQGTFEEIPLSKPTKPSKKKKVPPKGSVKKQNAMMSNSIEEVEPTEGEAEKNVVVATESPVYTLVVKKTDDKPEVIVEGPMVQVPTVQKPTKKKVKPAKVTSTTTTTEVAPPPQVEESEEYIEESDESTTETASS